jgi:hypothetical protein
MDGMQASQKVKDYFMAVHGYFSVWGFEVEDASPLASGDWVVHCSFFRHPMEAKRVSYEVTVGQEGDIVRVKRLEPTIG